MNNDVKRILVVDDDPDIGMMIKIILEYNGYNVSLLERAGEAEKEIRNSKPDLVIMDMLLSGMNGTDICSSLKKDPKTSLIPIIMFSAHPNAQQLCLDAGAEDFMAKPFDLNELLAKIDFQLA